MFSKAYSMPFEVLLSQKKNAVDNMSIDALLLDSLAQNPRTLLHIYSWKFPSATYGYFLEPSYYFNPDAIKNRVIEIAKRPTGGGIIFHHCDLAYSVLIPAQHPGYSSNTLANYAFINQGVAEAIKQFLGGSVSIPLLSQETESKVADFNQFCMAKPTKYDIMFQGCKVGGAAQRRTKYGLLHQGTICFYLPAEDFLKEVLLAFHDIGKAMEALSWPLLGKDFNVNKLEEAKKEMQFFLIQSIRKIVL